MTKNQTLALAEQRGMNECTQFNFKRRMNIILAQIKDDPEIMAKIRARVEENREAAKRNG